MPQKTQTKKGGSKTNKNKINKVTKKIKGGNKKTNKNHHGG